MPSGLPNQYAYVGVYSTAPLRKRYIPPAPPPATVAAAACGAARLAETAASFNAPSAPKSCTQYQSSYASPPSAAQGAPARPTLNDRRKPDEGATASAAWKARWRPSYSFAAVCICLQCQN